MSHQAKRQSQRDRTRNSPISDACLSRDGSWGVGSEGGADPSPLWGSIQGRVRGRHPSFQALRRADPGSDLVAPPGGVHLRMKITRQKENIFGQQRNVVGGGETRGFHTGRVASDFLTLASKF